MLYASMILAAKTTSNMLVTSALLAKSGFCHGFSLRTGGVSVGPFASLNLGRAVGDEPEHVKRNHEMLAQTLGYSAERLFEASQVHAAQVLCVDGQAAPVEFRKQEADALVVRAPHLPIAVRVADCVPVLIADPSTGAAAAVHVGWRGAVARVLEAAVQTLTEQGGIREQLIAALGPHIRVCCFEVSQEVADTIETAAHGERVQEKHTHGKAHVSLQRVLKAQLKNLGFLEHHIEDTGGCTCCEPERFFSFRRDGKLSGRHLAIILAKLTNA